MLTYCVVKASFGGDDAEAHYQMVVENLRKATRAWEKTCGVQFAYRPDFDGIPAGTRPDEVVFPVREMDVAAPSSRRPSSPTTRWRTAAGS